MKLYEVPNNTWVCVSKEEAPPPGGLSVNVNQKIKLINIDGMYSYCKTEAGDVIHLAAWTEVEVISDPRTIDSKTPA